MLGSALSPDGAASLEDWEAQLGDAEQKIAAPHRLWQREWAAITIRGIRRALDLRQPGLEDMGRRCAALKARLVALDDEELGPLRARIEAGQVSPEEFIALLADRPRVEWDAFTERLLGISEVPEAEVSLQMDMVHYLASKMDVIGDLVGLMRARPDGIFYDLGCGMGKVTLLVSWLAGVRAKGVEYDPAYARHAAQRAQALPMVRVEIIQADAREVDYSDGTDFYLYDPFRGEVLAAVLEKLRAAAEQHPILIYSRGNSTPALDQVSWLHRGQTLPSALTLFSSVQAG